MAKAKLDGVVEGVRYRSNGEIEWVRAYERRGAIYSDHVLLSREALIQRLKAGKHFVVGSRVPLRASTFEVASPIHLARANGGEVIVAGEGGVSSNRDDLRGAPII